MAESPPILVVGLGNSAADIAVSLHVYQRALRRSHVFVAEQAGTGAAGWLRREERVLVADPAP